MTEEELRQLNDSIAAEKSEQIDSEQAAIAEEIRQKEEEEAATEATSTTNTSQTAPQPPVASETPPQVETPQEQSNPLQGLVDKGKEVIGNAYSDPIGTVSDVQQQARKLAMPGLLGTQVAASNPLTAGLQAVTGQALSDFGMDAVGSIPGLGWVDDDYDEKTKWQNEDLQNVREKMSLIVPSLLAGGAATYATGGLAAPLVVKGLAALGVSTVLDVGVTALSDESEKADNMFRDLNDAFPQLNIPENLQTLDGDSPEVRTEKHLYDSIGLSIVGETLGFAMQLGKPIMKWMKPLNKTAESYKASQLATMIDEPTAKALSDIDGMMASGEVDPRQLENLQLKKNQLIQESTETGSSSVSNSGLESAAERADTSRQMQIDQDGMDALREAPDSIDYNPNITSAITDPVNTPRLTVDAGSVAKNMLDTTAIKRGVATGNPPVLLTPTMIRKGIGVDGTTRNMVMGVTEETRAVGRFIGVANKFRFSIQDMNKAAWQIYTDIMEAADSNAIRQLFASNRDVKTILGEQIDFINEEQATAVGFAMRDLVQTYLGREVTESSARVMDTIGREVSTQAQAVKQFGDSVANTPEIMNQVLDKMNFLTDEYAVNKYIAGWTLNNKKFWQRRFGNQAAEELTTQREMFDAAIKTKKGLSREFTKELKRVAAEDPKMASILVDAFTISDGDVTTLAKMNKYMMDQLNPLSMIWSPKGGMSMFASGMWAVRYNNILSGLAAIRAGVGSTVSLTLKPINAMVGLGIESLVTGDPTFIRSGMYAYGSYVETNRRAFKLLWQNYKKANVDPDSVVDMARKDYVQFNEEKFKVFDAAAEKWAEEGSWGKRFLYGWTKNNHNISRSKYMRYSTNAMVGIDAFTNSTMASQAARFQAYWDASKNGLSPKAMMEAEKQNYANFFTPDGLIKDSAVKNAAGEINMNLDTPLSEAIGGLTDQVPIAKSLFTFPRTGIGAINMALSYTPFNALPFIRTKYGKILKAGDDIDAITDALAAHGIDYNTTPNALNIYKNLRAEYRGRLATGAAMASGLMAYGFSGNVRGSGHHDPSRRQKERDNLGYVPFTAKIPGTDKWFDYRGLGEPIASLMTIIGNSSYYMGQIDQPVHQDILDKITWTITAAYTNQTFLSQLEPLAALINLDENAVSKFLANEARSFVPLSGAAGVLANGISSSQKDINNDLLKYVQNRLPGVNAMLPERIDYWTGEPLNDIDNPFLRALNAINPLKVSDGVEPWRVTLLELGYDGLSLISKDTSGSLEYPEEVREQLYIEMGKTKPYKEVKKILAKPRYQQFIKDVIAQRRQGKTSQDVAMQTSPLWDELNQVVTGSLKIAEQNLMNQNGWISEYIQAEKNAKKQSNLGNPEGEAQWRAQAKELLEMNK
jgi:hypothetical protein